ncbi:MAG: ATP-binding cassette domain-containing protein [Pseudomonadales bacterium]|nr:ATP-binding cassette domain-containing protein [Pseudomonadales bacterium]
MTRESVLEAIGVEKHYYQGQSDLHVLRGISFAVAAGERVAIVGLSGSGKSTLLHLLGGLDGVDGGKVLVEGQDLATLSQRALGELRNRCLGFVYQFHHLLPEFTARENIAMPLLIGGLSRADAGSRADEMLDAVGLSARASHKPGQLSGGERQRVALGRALVTKPRCVLADEPTGNLDERTAAEVDDLMISLSESSGTSFVVVTHNRDLASRMDRIYRLHDGQLELEA